jgi:hypothetical protein
MRHWGNKMNLAYVHRLLIAADEQPDEHLKVLGRRADREVRLMAGAGLVEATLSNGKGEPFTSINRLTDLGRTFLRAFKSISIPTGPRRTRIEGMAGEWNLNP